MFLYIFVNLLIVIKVKINTKVSTQSPFSGDFEDIVYEHYYMLERKLGMSSKPNMNTIICWKESWGCHRSQTSNTGPKKGKRKGHIGGTVRIQVSIFKFMYNFT
jgi:hypothetical protein